MPTIHPPSDSPSIGLLPAAKPGRHHHHINPNISFQIQLAIQIERIQFECKFILFKESFRPARPGYAPKKTRQHVQAIVSRAGGTLHFV
ncbi:hypothetical protein NMB33_08540 [Burkholderia sp. FXe9]|nr:hypothetical protein NMB33_08540 [Burkholderia sp. FXe9]